MDYKQVYDATINFLINTLENSGQNGFVVGVSGGVDSAVVSKLCAETGQDTLAVSMPIGETSSGDRRAKNHLENLSQYPHVTCKERDLTRVWDEFEEVFHEEDISDSVAHANTHSRLRMTMLYGYSNDHNRLVVGTDNAVESWLGFYTKGGDGVFDINPIGDLLKSEIWEFAEFLHINKEIIEADPTDGLWGDNRSDEEQLGADYEEIERFIELYNDNVYPSELSEEQREKYKAVIEQHESTRHKDNDPPSPYLACFT